MDTGEGERARKVGKVEVERNQERCKENWREQEMGNVAEVKLVRKRIIRIFQLFSVGNTVI
jgi:hypothetical protein